MMRVRPPISRETDSGTDSPMWCAPRRAGARVLICSSQYDERAVIRPRVVNCLVAPQLYACLGKVNAGGVRAAEQDADAFAGLRSVRAGKERCESCRAAGFGDDAQRVPQCYLRVTNRVIADEGDVIHIALREWEHERAAAACAERIRSDTGDIGINGYTGFKCACEGRGVVWFDA